MAIPIIQTLIALLGTMALVSVSGIFGFFLSRTVKSRIGWALVSCGSGLVVYAFFFLSDPWVQEEIRAEIARWV